MSDMASGGEFIPHSGVQPQTLQTLRLARASQAFLGTLAKPPELWEAFLLSQAQRMLLRCWLELRVRRIDSEAAAEAERSVVQRLEDVRREHGPWMAGLRVFLAGLRAIPTDSEVHEIVLTLMHVSAQSREAALRWIADPIGSRGEAMEEMNRLLRLAKAYHSAVGDGTTRRERGSESESGPRPASGGSPPAPSDQGESRSPVTRILPRGVKMETLQDVGRMDDCRRILKEFDPEVQVWECLCLVMADDASRQFIDDLVRRKKAAQDQTFAQDAQALFERLQAIRKEYGSLVSQLAGFLAELPVGRYATETRELALGFIVAGEVGRQHASLWLNDPDHYRQEAATRFEGLIGRAMNYQLALRAFAEG
jgi:hypothetical protein